MARGQKKQKSGGKHRARRVASGGNTHANRRTASARHVFDTDEESEGDLAPTLTNIARRLDASRRTATSNLRHSSILFVKPSQTEDPAEPNDVREKPTSHPTPDPEDATATTTIDSLDGKGSRGPVSSAETLSQMEQGTRQEAVDRFAGYELATEETQQHLLPDNNKKKDAFNASPRSRTKSKGSESGSDDEILFSGRLRRQPPSDKSRSTLTDKNAGLRVARQASLGGSPVLNTPPTPGRLSSHSSNDLEKPKQRSNSVENPASLAKPSNEPAQSSERGPHHTDPAFTFSDKLFHDGDGLEAVLDDYVANMRENGEFGFSTGLELDEWTGSDLADFDDLSTSDAEFEAIDNIIAKRERASGVQYLVVGAGLTVDEARWILQSSLVMPGADEMIEAFEEEEKFVAEMRASDEISESSSSESEEAGEETEFEDESDLIERKIQRMSDETIARLLSKQEELGLGSHELILFDDEPDQPDDSQCPVLEETSASARDFIALASRRSRKRQAKGIKTQPIMETFDFEEEELFHLGTSNGEDYGNFDATGSDRLSTRQSRRRKSFDFSQYISDEELQITLRESWEADRRKKKAKKAEREEMRAAGLLGGGGRKSANGTRMDIESRNIKDRFAEFLLDEHEEQLAFPPMEKSRRKILHELSGVFGLKSKSAGSGKNRFPVLYKTNRTPRDFDDKLFSRMQSHIESRLTGTSRGRGSGGRRFALPKNRGSGGNAGRAGSFYMEGETVGAGAAELGVGNRGHAMLEKMGWSKGMVLGALGNERGILQPIEHVVKKTRAGLG